MTNSTQLRAGVIISYITTAVNILVNLIYTPLLTTLLGQSEYGLYTVVASIVNYLSLFSLGFGSAYLRFYSQYKEQRKKDDIAKLNGMFLLVFIVLGICAFATGMFLVENIQVVLGSKVTSGELQTAKILMLILVINIVLTFPTSVFNSIIIAHECYIFQRSVNLLSKLANPLLVIPLLLAGYKSVAVVLVTTGLTLFTLIINAFYCFRKLRVKFVFRGLDFRILTEIGSFSFFIFLNMIIDQINWSVDKFLLIRFSGTAAVAVYGVASQINTLYLLFSTQISSVFEPRVNQIVAKNDSHMDETLTRLFTKVGRIQNMVVLLILSGFIVFGEFFIKLWVGDDYRDVYPIALLLIVPVTVPLIQNLGIEIQKAKNRHQFRSLVYLGIAILNTLISIPLTKCYGAIGSALGTAVALTIGNIFIMNIYYQKRIGLDMYTFWKSIATFIPAMIPCTIFGVFIKCFVEFDSLTWYVVMIMIFTILYCGSMWKLGMNDEEKELVHSILKRVKR